MVFSIIKPQTAVPSIMVDGNDWTDVVQRARVRSTLPQQDATTFATQQHGAFIGGTERITIDLIGLQTKGDDASGPFMPLSNYQDVAVEVQYDTFCSIAANCNGQDAGIDQTAGVLGNVDGQFVSTDTIAVTWSGVAGAT